ncbi:helix-turn-helix domain-containing protein [Fusobacterium pseudoperiodonticum]|jgi:hypothetical protein|uniref:HTH cro/C1-type domain-containing protein n=1 Tax=Fusobacterium pseudoperiodonticum TaxID=2663009 RepID=A0AAD0AL21_9FUSO|nr:helix-turn-helix domain-containing protein [Fusobacterium pseudoperiodonticum]ATV35697.1 XRE family transcriptional regulator [Fusobacterium pseudoperiodonticum]ATV61410.1 hypothetical protein CTM74_06005 [Fusobacterium pseudoperiodonticum]DAY29244.1 MAG TPA: Repressor protein CI [Caudoviricetes sp.]
MKINEKIKELRKNNNLTQKEMAKKLGVSLSSLQKYEYGDFYPSIEVIKNIVDLFNITLSDFLDVSDITNEEKEVINWNIKRSRELEKEFENDIEENTRNIEILLEDKEIDLGYSDIIWQMSMMNFYFRVNTEKKEINIEFYNDLKFINDKGVYDITLTLDEFKVFLSYIEETLKLNILSALMLKAKKH